MTHFEITGDEIGCFTKETTGWRPEIYAKTTRKKFKKKNVVEPPIIRHDKYGRRIK